MNKSKGFTLIELMVVTGIISTLSSVVTTNLQNARLYAQDLARVESLITIRNALELYYTDNQSYPATFSGAYSSTTVQSTRKSECSNPGAYIPNLTPKYLAELPKDPALSCGGPAYSFLYASNGVEYKIITHPVLNRFPKFKEFPTSSGWNGHYGVWSPGAENWQGL